MQNSEFKYLQSVTKVVLVANKIQDVSGLTAVEEEVISQSEVLVQQISNRIQKSGLDVTVAAGNLDLDSTLHWLNENFAWGEAWIIDIEQDLQGGNNFLETSTRCGVIGYGSYTLPSGENFTQDQDSMEIARFCCDQLISGGAYITSWAKTDDEMSAVWKKNFIREIKCLSHVFYLGSVKGDNTIQNLNNLAQITAASIYTALTGDSGIEQIPQFIRPNPIETVSSRSLVAKGNVGKENSRKLKNLVDEKLWDKLDKETKNQISEENLSSLLQNYLQQKEEKEEILNQKQHLEIDLQNWQTNSLKKALSISGFEISQLQNNLKELVENNNFAGIIEEFNKLHSQNGQLNAGLVRKDTDLNLLNKKVRDLRQKLDNKNPALKPFWLSKKWWTEFTGKIIILGSAAWLVSGLNNNENWQTLTIKLGLVALVVVAVSWMGSSYLKAQSEVDKEIIRQNGIK